MADKSTPTRAAKWDLERRASRPGRRPGQDHYRRAFREAHGEGPWPCYFCGNEVTRDPRGPQGFVIHHTADTDDPATLAPAHRGCHTSFHSRLRAAISEKKRLSPKRREPRSDEELVDAIARQLRSLAKRLASGDPDQVRLIKLVRASLDEAWADAVAGWRETGFSDTTIGRELGITKQAVRQRWPRASK